MPLKVSDGIAAWIKDFQKSDAPQFKGKSDKERQAQAVAAYLSAKRGDTKEDVNEDMTFKVEVEGLPALFMSGNSPGQVKNHLRKLIKQPSMIKSVERQTKHDVKKMYRKKAQGKTVDESTVNELSPDTVKSYKKAASKSNYSAAQKYARVAASPTGRKYKNKEMGKQDDIMRKRKAGLAMADKKEGSCGEVDYGSDKSIKIMKKKTPGETNEKITLAKVRGALYKTAKAMGDVQAVRKKKVGKRVARRVAGKAASKVLRNLIK